MLNSPRVITNMRTESHWSAQQTLMCPEPGWGWGAGAPCVRRGSPLSSHSDETWGLQCPGFVTELSWAYRWSDLPGGPRCGVTRDTERKCNEDGFIIWIQTCLSWDARAGLDQYILLWSFYQTIRLNRIINCSFQNVTILRNHFLNLFLIKSV